MSACNVPNNEKKCSCSSTPLQCTSDLFLKYELLYKDLYNNQFPQTVYSQFLLDWIKTMEGVTLYNTTAGLIIDIKSAKVWVYDTAQSASSGICLVGKQNLYKPVKNITFKTTTNYTIAGYCDIDIETPEVEVATDSASTGEVVTSVSKDGVHGIKYLNIKNNKTKSSQNTNKLYLVGAQVQGEEQETGSNVNLWVQDVNNRTILNVDYLQATDANITNNLNVGGDITVEGDIVNLENKTFVCDFTDASNGNFVYDLEKSGDTIIEHKANIAAGDGIIIETGTLAQTNGRGGGTTTYNPNDIVISSTAVSIPVPVGGIIMWGSSLIPDGWLLCNGQEVPINEYEDLYDVIGMTFSQVSPSPGNFRLPNLQLRFPIGSGTGYSIGSTGGSDSVTLGSSNIPKHRHTVSTEETDESGVIGFYRNADGTGQPSRHNSLWTINPADPFTWHSSYYGGDANGNTTPFSIVPKYLALNFIIRAR